MMCEPVVFFWKGFVNAIVEVLVMREDDMSADIVQLVFCQIAETDKVCTEEILTKPSFVTSVEARPPGVSFESTIIHDGPS